MKTRSLLFIVIAVLAAGGFAIGCGGGGGGGTNNPSQVQDGDDGEDQDDDPAPEDPAGDPSDPEIPLEFAGGDSFGPFPGQVVGVSAENGRVYITTEQSVQGFLANGTQIGEVQAGSQVLPPAPLQDVELLPSLGRMADGRQFPFPRHPVILGQVGGPGNPGLSILPPNLDGEINLAGGGTVGPGLGLKRVRLPRFFGAEITIPNLTQPEELQPPYWQINSWTGMDTLPTGEILVRASMQCVGGDDQESFGVPNALMIFDPQRGAGTGVPHFQLYHPVNGIDCVGIPATFFHGGFLIGRATDVGPGPSRFGIGSVNQRANSEISYRTYFEDFTLTRDFYGVSQLTVNRSTSPFEYSVPPVNTDDQFRGYRQIIGSGFGAGEGEFAEETTECEGALSGGGPAGIAVDKQRGFVYVADPGNSRVHEYRIQSSGVGLPVFDYRRSLGSGAICPDDIDVDQSTGTLYVATGNQVLVFKRGQADIAFGNLVGQVSNPSVGTVADARVEVNDQFGNDVATVFTNSSGNYEVENIPIGQYDITASKSGFLPDQGTVELVPDETVRFDLTLDTSDRVEKGGVSGSVTNCITNEPVVGATVNVIGTSISTTTGPDGFYSLQQIAPDNYQIRVTREGVIESKIKDVFIRSNTNQVIDFRVPSTGGQC